MHRHAAILKEHRSRHRSTPAACLWQPVPVRSGAGRSGGQCGSLGTHRATRPSARQLADPRWSCG
ncbi:MAG: hypothetical protein ACK55Z_22495, partial [bacterium]